MYYYYYKLLRWLALRSLQTLRVRLRHPSGVPSALSITHSSYFVYATIDNKMQGEIVLVKFWLDNGSMVCTSKLLNQLG